MAASRAQPQSAQTQSAQPVVHAQPATSWQSAQDAAGTSGGGCGRRTKTAREKVDAPPRKKNRYRTQRPRSRCRNEIAVLELNPRARLDVPDILQAAGDLHGAAGDVGGGAHSDIRRVLPVGQVEVHGRRVDLLYDADAPKLHVAVDDHAPRTDRPKAGQDQSAGGARGRRHQTRDAVAHRAVLSVEGGGTPAGPVPLNAGIDPPQSGVGTVAGRIEVEDLVHVGAVILVLKPGAAYEQARGDVNQAGRREPVPPMGIVEFVIGRSDHDDVRLAVVVPAVAEAGGDTEAVPFAGVAAGHVPEVVLAESAAESEAMPCRR